MVDYINAYEVVRHRQSMIITASYNSENISSVSIDEYLKDEERRPGCEWNPRNTKIDEDIIDWLENNVEGNWLLDMCGRDIYFENVDDSWHFLEWLEEYGAKVND